MRLRRLSSLCFLLAAIWLFSPSLHAQDPPVEAPQPAAGENQPNVWERLIYLPYKNLEDAFGNLNSSVLIPYAEYRKLLERAGITPVDPERPPVTALISEANYTANIDKELARITAKFKVQVLDRPWAEIPLAFGDAAVGEVTASDQNVMLRGTGDGTYALLLPSKGQHEVTIELVARVHTSPDGRSFDLSVPSTAITTLDLVVPQADQTIEVTPRLVALPADSEANQTHTRASLGATNKITARWFPRASAKPEMDLLASVTNYSAVSVEEGLMHVDTTLEYEILRGTLSQLRIAVPKEYRILDIASTTARVRNWQSAEEANRQVITVELLSPVSNRAVIEVHAERPIGEEAFPVSGIDADGKVHGIHAIDALRESGQLALSSSPTLNLTVEEQQGLARLEEAEVRENLRRAGARYFKFYNQSFRLTALARSIQPRLLVTQTTHLHFGDAELSIKSQLNYQIERTGVFELKLLLPENFTVDRVECSSLKEYYVDAMSRVLTVSLLDRQMQPLAVTITGRVPLPAASSESLMLPLIEPQGVERETGNILVYALPSIEVIADRDAVVGAFPLQSGEAGSLLEQSDTEFTAAWTYHRRPVQLPVRTIRKPTRLTAQVATAANVGEDLVSVATTLNYDVEFAGIDTLRFAVPEAVADRIQIEAIDDTPAIKQKSRAAEAEDGWVTWTVVLQESRTGTQSLRVSYDLPQATPTAGAQPAAQPAELTLQPLRPLGLPAKDNVPEIALVAVVGEISVQKDRALSVTASSSGGDIEPIDVRELELLSDDASLAYRYHQQPAQLVVKWTKLDIQGVVETIVSRALVEVVLGRDASATYRCRYQVKSSQRQRIPIDLPAGMETLAVLVDGAQTALEERSAGDSEEGWNSYFVNVARSKRSDETFQLTLLFRVPIQPAPFEWRRGVLLLRLPRIGGSEADDVAVQQMRVAAWVPEEFSLVGSPDRFVKETRTRVPAWNELRIVGDSDTVDMETWIGGAQGAVFDFPTEGHVYRFSNLGGAPQIEVTWWHMPFVTAVISGALFVIALLLLGLSWERKVMVVLLLAFIAALWAASDLDSVLHAVTGARYGLVAGLLAWVIHGLAAARRSTDSTATAADEPIATTPPAIILPPGVLDEPGDRPEGAPSA